MSRDEARPRRDPGDRWASRWSDGWESWWETLHAEWTKLRTLPGTGWLLAAIIVLTIAIDAAASSSVNCPASGCAQDPVKLSLTGIEFGQALVAMLAVLVVSGEYGTGMIQVTFSAMPRRGRVLAAKAALVAGLTLVAGSAAVGVSVLIARYVMPGHGFTTARGYPPLSLGDGTTLRAAGGAVLYLALISLFSLGIAALARDSAASIGIVLGVFYLSPIMAQVVTDPAWHNRIERYAPMNAGLAIESTRGLASLPIGPWEGLGVLAAWAGAALLAGGGVLRLRDSR